jgi:desulfoferrodoxin (superoxide reductase-like protein)
MGSIATTSLITTTGASVLLNSGCQGSTTYEDGYQPYWNYRADVMEQHQLSTVGSIRTLQDPQNHNPDAHVPQVTFNAGIATVLIDHPMVVEHWIPTVYVRDATTNQVIYLQELLAPNPAQGVDPATVKGLSLDFAIPEGTAQIAVYAYCNLHELWVNALPVI